MKKIRALTGKIKEVFPGKKGLAFLISCILIIISYAFFSTTLANKTVLVSSNFYAGQKNIVIPVSIEPQKNDFALISLRVSNNNSVDFPSGSIQVKWIFEGQDDFPAVNRQSVNIFIDGINHDYYLPLGENKYWSSGKSGSRIIKLEITLPEIEGINFQVRQFDIKRRIAFPLDIFINLKLKDFLGFSYTEINRYLTPAYLLTAVFLVILCLYLITFKKFYMRKAGFSLGKHFSIFVIVLLLIFSINYAANAMYTLKSYYDSFKKYIYSPELDLSQTYLGFYNFEKFIFWLSTKIPEGENMVVLVRGEPVYIMSEMAYNLYPKDVKFIDISHSKETEVINRIKSLNTEYDKKYKYIIALSKEDGISVKDLILIDQYNQNGGLVYQFGN